MHISEACYRKLRLAKPFLSEMALPVATEGSLRVCSFYA